MFITFLKSMVFIVLYLFVFILVLTIITLVQDCHIVTQNRYDSAMHSPLKLTMT